MRFKEEEVGSALEEGRPRTSATSFRVRVRITRKRGSGSPFFFYLSLGFQSPPLLYGRLSSLKFFEPEVSSWHQSYFIDP